MAASASSSSDNAPPARTERLRRSSDIAAVRSMGRSARRSCFALRARPSDGSSRLAVSASRALGGAVMRNRARRRLREAFRRALPPTMRFDLLVSARRPALDAPFAALLDEARSALGEITS